VKILVGYFILSHPVDYNTVYSALYEFTSTRTVDSLVTYLFNDLWRGVWVAQAVTEGRALGWWVINHVQAPSRGLQATRSVTSVSQCESHTARGRVQ